MKMKRCNENGCRELIPLEKNYCSRHKMIHEIKKHEAQAKQKQLQQISIAYQQNERHTKYVNSKRSKKLEHEFYQTTQWRRVAELVKIRDMYVCQACGKVQIGSESFIADHIVSRLLLERSDWLEIDNLWTLCRTCHNHKSAIERSLSDAELLSMTKAEWVEILRR